LLNEGLNKLEKLEQNVPKEEYEYFILLSRNLINVARLIIRSALYREESRGGHYREDFPKVDEAYLFHIVQQKGKDITTIPVKDQEKYKLKNELN
ncbi:MAG: L-aspartate oxidase, partial [Odoribacter sp.]|nr:L-aspartate oxidase [Odoribacter sp.]